MNNILIKIHTEPFDKINTFSPYDTNRNCERTKQNNLMVEKSAEITTDVAIKFAEFLCKYPDKNRNVHGEILHAKSKYDEADTTKNLFEEFINNHYTK